MNLGQIRTLARTLLSEPSAIYWSDSELNNYINYGAEDFAVRTDCLEGIFTDSQVQYQADYTLPSNYTKIKQAEIWKGNTTYDLTPQSLRDQANGVVKFTSSPPDEANIYDGKLRLSARPNTAAANTTLNGTIGAADTSLILTSASGFSRMGRLKIDSEVIIYWNISTATISPCERGAEGTTAAAHTTGATITQRDIYIYGFKKPATLSSDTDTLELPTQFHKAIAFYAAAIGRRKSKDHDLADKYEAEYERNIAQAQEWVHTKWRIKRTPL